MRIAVTSLYLPGSSKIGVGHQVHHFADRLVGRGHEVTVLSPDEPGDDARYTHRRVDPGASLRTFRFAWRLRHEDLAGFDILHSHGDDCFLPGVTRPPHVRTVHGSCFAEALRIPGAKSRLRMVMLGAGEVASTTVVADRSYGVSEATKRVYPWLDGVIPNGVEVASTVDRRPTPDPTILFVGSFENRKRGRLLMEHFAAEVRPRVPDARLLMVCDDAPSAPGVEVLGRVSDDDLTALYRSAWVFCLPSSYEGFGIPYVEAMANGCPVVATPNPGAVEVLGHGRFGVLAEPGRLGDALVDLLDDPDRRDLLARRGRERAGDFAWDGVLDAYEQVYAELLGRRPR
jgi:phosphatidyl-myo-inositol alpha-mannosyltransferase